MIMTNSEPHLCDSMQLPEVTHLMNEKEQC